MSKSLCCFAFETLQQKVSKSKRKLPSHHQLSTDSSLSDSIPLSKYLHHFHESITSFPSSAPLFITWNQNGQLRGCIGTFQSLPLESGVKKFSISAGFQDPRFHPIQSHEVSLSLSVAVTLLDNFTPIHSPQDWEIGLNGLKLSFVNDDQHYLGTFLPSVAEEEEWDKLTTLYYLLKKADYNYIKKDEVLLFYTKGLKEGWLSLTRYDGLKSSLDYNEYVTIRSEIV